MEEPPAPPPQQILDLSNQKIKKLTKPPLKEAQATTLILDDNELQRLDNIDSFLKLQKLTAVRNQLLRMYGVCRLHCLLELNLAHNGILTIEGLKELVNLKWLCLAGNNIKTIEHLNTNVNLEYIDLSENSITYINDLSFIRNLKELYLHNNKINHFRQCDRFLPDSLETLTLANNNVTDLNEVSQLAHLKNLTSISFANNPCVNITGGNIGFDYRPFIINWCVNVNVIDGYMVGAIESLRAEWLYSQGRGRQFRIGEHNALVQYLAHTCPLTGEALESEENRKLRLILSKAQHHQQQLKDEQLNPEMASPSPSTRKKLSNRRPSCNNNSSRKSKSPTPTPSSAPNRMTTSCYTPVNSARPKSPDRMSSSCHIPSSSSSHRLKSPDRSTSGGIINCYSPNMSSSRVARSPDRGIYSPKPLRTPKSPPDRYYSPGMSRTAKTPDPSSTGYYYSGPGSHQHADSPDRMRSPNRMSSSCYNIGSLANSQASMSVDGGMLRRNSISRIHCNSAVFTPEQYNGERMYAGGSPVPDGKSGQEHCCVEYHRPMSFIEHHFPGSGPRLSPPVARSPKPVRTTQSARARSLASNVRKSHSPSPARHRRFSNSSMTSKREALSRSSTIRKSPSNSEDDTDTYSSMYESPPLRRDNYYHPVSVPHRNMNEKVEKAAVCIQKTWRGYYTRNKNKEVQDVFRLIQTQRANQYLQKLTNDMESAKLALESERKIQMLQTEAISALWRKVSSLQGNSPYENNTVTSSLGAGDNSDVVKRLAATCTVLQGQIEQLQNSMQDIVKVMTVFSQNLSLNGASKETGIATQTEIIAVHTPQGDTAKVFPFQKQCRPSSLPLPVSQKKKESVQNNSVNVELKQYAGTLVDGVMRAVSEQESQDVTVFADNTSREVSEINGDESAETIEEASNQQTI